MDIQRSAGQDPTTPTMGEGNRAAGAYGGADTVAVGPGGNDGDEPYSPVPHSPSAPHKAPLQHSPVWHVELGTHFTTGLGQVPPMHPPDPVGGFFGQAIPYRRTDWLILTLVLVLAALVMVGFCLVGFAVYNRP